MIKEPIHFEKYLLKSTDELLAIEDLKINNPGVSTEKLTLSQSLNFEFYSEYFGLKANQLQVILDKQKRIKAISLVFSVLLNDFFFYDFVQQYKEPNQVLKKHKLIRETKSETKREFYQKLTKREYSIKTVSLNDQPERLFWINSDYTIEIRINYEIKISQITFRL